MPVFSRVVSFLLRIGEIAFGAVVAGIIGSYLHDFDSADAVATSSVDLHGSHSRHIDTTRVNMAYTVHRVIYNMADGRDIVFRMVRSVWVTR